LGHVERGCHKILRRPVLVVYLGVPVCVTGTLRLINHNPVFLVSLYRLGFWLRSLGGLEIAFVSAAKRAAPIFWQVFERCAGVNAVAWVAFGGVVDVVTDYATILGHDLLLENLVVG
jgi:hypothetical protein